MGVGEARVRSVGLISFGPLGVAQVIMFCLVVFLVYLFVITFCFLFSPCPCLPNVSQG